MNETKHTEDHVPAHVILQRRNRHEKMGLSLGASKIICKDFRNMSLSKLLRSTSFGDEYLLITVMLNEHFVMRPAVSVAE